MIDFPCWKLAMCLATLIFCAGHIAYIRICTKYMKQKGGRVMENGVASQKQKVSVLGAVFMIYSMVCAGAFGIEDMISVSGPGLTLLLLCIVPFLRAIPNALVSAELGSAIPEIGGSYAWAKRAFGEFWGFIVGFGTVLGSYIGLPAYIVLAGNYLGSLLGLSDVITFILKLVLIAIFGYISWKGVKDVTVVGTVLGFIVIAGFISVMIVGFSNAQYNPVEPFMPPGQSAITAISGGLGIVMWMYGGYEAMGAVAGELENPQVIPKALIIVIPIVLLTYIPTTIAGLASVGNWENWGTDATSWGHVVGLAGTGFMTAFVLVAFCSQLSIFNSFLAVAGRFLMALSIDGFAPKFLTKTNKQGVPVGPLFIAVIFSAVFSNLSFGALAGLTIAVLLFANALFMLAGIKLRISEPDMERPFKVKLNNFWFGVLCMTGPLVSLAAFSLGGIEAFLFGGIVLILSPAAYILLRRQFGGLTKVDPENNPQNSRTKLPYGDVKRISLYYLIVGFLSFGEMLFFRWFEDPTYYIESYNNPDIFNIFLLGVLAMAIVSFVLAVIAFVIYKKVDDIK